MTRADVRFGFNKALEIAFVQRGQVVLHDTCMMVSGPVLRFRMPFINRILEGLLAWPSYRTIPYGAVVRYFASYTLRRQSTLIGAFHRQHTVDFRLPSGEEVRLSFAVLGGTGRSKAFQSALNDNLTATRALFEQ
jgi:hypothetical protein